MKVSIVAEGGSFRTAYVLGSLDALYNHFKLKRVDYAVGSSISLGLLAYYISGEIKSVYPIVKNYLSKPNTLSLSNLLKGKPYINTSFVIDNVAKGKNPEIGTRLKNSKVKFIIPVTNARTGKVKYFYNKTADIFSAMKAGMLMPILGGSEVEIDGNNYVDGGIVDPIPIDAPGIEQSRKIIILTKTKEDALRESAVFKIVIRTMKWKLEPELYKAILNREKIYQKRIKQIEKLEKNGDIVLRPAQRMYGFDRKFSEVKKNANLGYNDSISNTKLVELVRELKSSDRKKFYFG